MSRRVGFFGPRRPARARDASWRRKRHRFYLGLLLVAIVLTPAIVWRLNLAAETDRMLTALQAQGSPITLEALNAERNTEEQGPTRAKVYLEAGAQSVSIDKALLEVLPYRGNNRPVAGMPLSPEMRRATEALVGANEGLLATLHEASALPAGRFIEAYDLYSSIYDVAYLETCDWLVTILCCEAVLLDEQGNDRGAMASMQAALALLQAMESEALVPVVLSQWKLEARVADALQRILTPGAASIEDLEALRAQFDVSHRAARWQRACDVEQCLFLSRLRTGRHHGLTRSLLLAAGLGDLNVGAYLSLMAAARGGFGLSDEEQAPYRAQYNDVIRRLGRNSLLYGTVHASMPPAFFKHLRERTDESLAVAAALDVLIYDAENGAWPESLGGASGGADRLLTDGTALVFETVDGGFKLYSTSVEENRIDWWTCSSTVHAVEPTG